MRNGGTIDKQSLKPGDIIMRYPESFPINFEDGEGPFKSIRGVKRNSQIYKQLKKTDIKRAQKIVLDKNIFKSSELIAVPKGMEFVPDVLEIFKHAISGKIIKGKISGVHFYNPKKVKIIEIIEKNDITEVFLARFEYFDLKNQKWLKKDKPSTFFPKKWNLSQLLQECKFAYDQIDLSKIDNNVIKSITFSKIEVEIVFQNGKVKTIYPII